MQKVSEIMHHGVERIPDGASVQEAAHKMRELDIGFLCVTDGSSITGCVTDRDLAMGALADNLSAHDTRVGDFTSKDVLAIEANASVKDAIKLMIEHKLQRLLVKDHQGGPVGVLALADLINNRDDDELVLQWLRSIKMHH